MIIIEDHKGNYKWIIAELVKEKVYEIKELIYEINNVDLTYYLKVILLEKDLMIAIMV